MSRGLTLPRNLADRLIRWRWPIALLIASSALGSAVIAWRAPFRTSLVQNFLSDPEVYQGYRQRAEMLGGTSDDLIYLATVEGPDLLSPEVFRRIRLAAEAIQQLPEVASVIALTDAPWLGERRLSFREIAARTVVRKKVDRGGDDLDIETGQGVLYWPRDPEFQEAVDWDALRRAIADDSLVRGLLLSRDLQGQAMIVRLRSDAGVQGWRQVRLRETLETILHQNGLGRDAVYSAGVIIMEGRMLQEVLQSMALLLPCGAVIVSLVVWGVFGNLRVVVLMLLIASAAIAWSMGAAGALFGEISILVAGVPLLILVISTSDTVHLASAYYDERRNGADRRQAMARTIQQVGGACLLTSITTAIGFLSMVVIPAATVRHVAVASAIGVGGALLLALMLTPIYFSWLPDEEVRRQGPRLLDRLAEWLVDRCRDVTLNHPWLVLLACLLLVLVSLWGAARIQLDADFTARFQKNHPVRSSDAYFRNQLFGVNTMEVFLRVPPETTLEPATLQRVAELQDRLEKLPDVDSVTSIVSLFRLARKSLGYAQPEAMPSNARQAAGLLRLLDQSLSAGGVRAVAPEQGLIRLAVRAKPTRIFELLRVTREIDELARGVLPSGVGVEVTGAYPIIARAADQIIDNQRQGFVLCFLSVMIMVGWGLRSLRLSLLAIPPNLAPLLFLGGLLGWTTDIVDSDVLGVAIISFGLAVDDTIHFLHRYQLEFQRWGERKAALDAAYRSTGRAILQTTMILGLGLSPFLLSGFLSLWMLGSYLVFVLAAAVLGDLLMLPALVLLFDRRRVDAASPAA